MDYFARCDDFIVSIIFDALGEDAAAIIARPLLRATCRRFAHLLPPTVSRYDFSWILAQSLIVARKFAQGRTDLVREITSAPFARTQFARDNVRAHWWYMYESALLSMSAENFALICDTYIALSIDNLGHTLSRISREYDTYEKTYKWMSDMITHAVQYWSIDSTITFLRKFLSAESLRIIDECEANLAQCDTAQALSRDLCAMNLRETAVTNIIVSIMIARKFGPNDPRLGNNMLLIDGVLCADRERELALAHIEGRETQRVYNEVHSPDDPIPFSMKYMSLYSRASREQCIRQNPAKWARRCRRMFSVQRCQIPPQLLSRAYRPFIVEEIARNKRRTIFCDTVIRHECLAAAYGIPCDRKSVSSSMHHDAAWYFLAITITQQSPQVFAQTLREYGRDIHLWNSHFKEIVRALNTPHEVIDLRGAHCATPRQNLAILRAYFQIPADIK